MHNSSKGFCCQQDREIKQQLAQKAEFKSREIAAWLYAKLTQQRKLNEQEKKMKQLLHGSPWTENIGAIWCPVGLALSQNKEPNRIVTEPDSWVDLMEGVDF